MSQIMPKRSGASAAAVEKTEGTACTQCVKLAGEDLTMKTSAGLACEISAECVARSQLLRDLTDTDGAANEASIPVSEDAFRLWMHHVNAGGCGPCLTPEASGQTFAVNGVDDPSPSRIVSVADAPAGQTQACDDSVDGEDPLSAASAAERLCQLVTVADVLIDEDTKNTTAARLAALLQRHAAKSSSDIADQVRPIPPACSTCSHRTGIRPVTCMCLCEAGGRCFTPSAPGSRFARDVSGTIGW
eukprot:jgi/Ulvmu1/2137/UM128_0007.1